MTTEITPAKAPKPAAYPLIYARMAAVMAAVGAITKDRRNVQQNYAFRGVDDCMNALHGPLSANGIVFGAAVRDVVKTSYATKTGTAMLHITLVVTYTFYAADGSSMSYEAVGEASDSGDKAAGKAQAYALKVALLQIFCIPTEEQKDTEYASPERAVEPVAAAIQYATASQQESIIRLLNDPAIKLDEKTKMLLAINQMDGQRAARTIANLTDCIVERTRLAVDFDTANKVGTPNPFRTAQQ